MTIKKATLRTSKTRRAASSPSPSRKKPATVRKRKKPATLRIDARDFVHLEGDWYSVKKEKHSALAFLRRYGVHVVAILRRVGKKQTPRGWLYASGAVRLAKP